MRFLPSEGGTFYIFNRFPGVYYTLSETVLEEKGKVVANSDGNNVGKWTK